MASLYQDVKKETGDTAKWNGDEKKRNGKYVDTKLSNWVLAIGFFHRMQSIEQWRDDISCTTKIKFISKIVRSKRDEIVKKNGNYRSCVHIEQKIFVDFIRLSHYDWIQFCEQHLKQNLILNICYSSALHHSSKCLYLAIGYFIKISMLCWCRCHRLFLSFDIFSLSSFRFSTKKKQFRSFYILARFYRRTLSIDSNKWDSTHTDAEYDEKNDEK